MRDTSCSINSTSEALESRCRNARVQRAYISHRRHISRRELPEYICVCVLPIQYPRMTDRMHVSRMVVQMMITMYVNRRLIAVIRKRIFHSSASHSHSVRRTHTRYVVDVDTGAALNFCCHFHRIQFAWWCRCWSHCTMKSPPSLRHFHLDRYSFCAYTESVWPRTDYIYKCE